MDVRINLNDKLIYVVATQDNIHLIIPSLVNYGARVSAVIEDSAETHLHNFKTVTIVSYTLSPLFLHHKSQIKPKANQ